MKTCRDCSFHTTELGECRRNAPMPQGHRQFAHWPKVKPSDGCGQYQAAASEQPLEKINQGCLAAAE